MPQKMTRLNFDFSREYLHLVSWLVFGYLSTGTRREGSFPVVAVILAACGWVNLGQGWVQWARPVRSLG